MKLEDLPSHSELAAKALKAASHFIEEFTLFPIILQRSRELTSTHAPQLKNGNPFWMRFTVEYLHHYTPDPLTPLTGKGMFNAVIEAIQELALSILQGKKFLKEASNKKFFFHENLIPWEQLDTKFSETTASTLACHFFSYYRLAYGKAPSENRELFFAKREELKRTLSYCQGHYQEEGDQDPHQDSPHADPQPAHRDISHAR